MPNPHDEFFTTGLAPLPDIGTLSYNGVRFSSLFHSKVASKFIQDSAGRTTKLVKYTLNAIGVVTLLPPETTTDSNLIKMKELLSQQGGILTYTGRGFGKVIVNGPSATKWDVQWGPIPDLLDFQPLGGGLGAQVSWTITYSVNEYTSTSGLIGSGPYQPGFTELGPLEFTVENGLTYDEEGYAQITMRGTLEIPLTRTTVDKRTIVVSADSYRDLFISQVMKTIDLTRFRVSRRHFPVSSDRRTMNWEVVADEIPPMGDPPGATNARGRFTVRKVGGDGKQLLKATTMWICSMTCTYTIRKDWPRRCAYDAFMYLLWYRMEHSKLGQVYPDNPPQPPFNTNPNLPAKPKFDIKKFPKQPAQFYRELMTRKRIPYNPYQEVEVDKPKLAAKFANILGLGFLIDQKTPLKTNITTPKALLLEFGADEGLYRDSKNITFEASWLLMTRFEYLLAASGLWRSDPDAIGGDVWKLSIQDIQGPFSWSRCDFNVNQDVIVDMGTTKADLPK